MPAVTEGQKRTLRAGLRKRRMKDYIRGQMKEKKAKHQDCGDAIGMERSTFTKALENMTFNTTQLIMLLDFLEAEPMEVAMILARE